MRDSIHSQELLSHSRVIPETLGRQSVEHPSGLLESFPHLYRFLCAIRSRHAGSSPRYANESHSANISDILITNVAVTLSSPPSQSFTAYIKCRLRLGEKPLRLGLSVGRKISLIYQTVVAAVKVKNEKYGI